MTEDGPSAVHLRCYFVGEQSVSKLAKGSGLDSDPLQKVAGKTTRMTPW